MGPFREPPQLELGPLEVGLVEAAEQAIAKLPRGGRLRCGPGLAPHTLGALGSAGLVLAALAAFVSATSAWRPDPGTARGVIATLVLAAGLSLALLLRATDRAASRRIVRGEVVGRAARRTLARVVRLARAAERQPDRFGGRRIRALARSLSAARDLDVAPWIPSDVRGRGKLLLARATALQGGPRWSDDERALTRVDELLRSAARLLADPTPARADLTAVRNRPTASTRRILEVRGDPDVCPPSEGEDEVLAPAVRHLSVPRV